MLDQSVEAKKILCRKCVLDGSWGIWTHSTPAVLNPSFFIIIVIIFLRMHASILTARMKLFIQAVFSSVQTNKTSKSVLGPWLAICYWTLGAYASMLTTWQNSGHTRGLGCTVLEMLIRKRPYPDENWVSDFTNCLHMILWTCLHNPETAPLPSTNYRYRFSTKSVVVSFLRSPAQCRWWLASSYTTQVPPGEPWRPALCGRTAGTSVRGAAGPRTACSLIEVSHSEWLNDQCRNSSSFTTVPFWKFRTVVAPLGEGTLLRWIQRRVLLVVSCTCALFMSSLIKLVYIFLILRYIQTGTRDWTSIIDYFLLLLTVHRTPPCLTMTWWSDQRRYCSEFWPPTYRQFAALLVTR